MRFCKILIILIILSFFGGLIAYQQSLKMPKELTIATGSKLGGYYYFAKKYQPQFKEHGINLQIKTSAGSVEALQLLEKGEVDIAFVQGGTADKKYHKKFISLASVFYEPLWVFYNGDEQINYLNQLKGKKISIGKQGSGTRAMFEVILKENGIKEENLLALNNKEAIQALKEKTIDAYCIVVSPKSPLISELLQNKNIKLMSFQRKDAYKDKYNYINSLTLHEGVIDLEKNIPQQDIEMLSTTASLVTNVDLNSDLQRFIIKMIRPIHKDGAILEPKEYFPTANFVQIPISEHTKNYLEQGEPWLEKFLPFWLATLIDNLFIFLLPLIPLYIIYDKFLLPSYSLRVNHLVYVYNESLRTLELMIDTKQQNTKEIKEELLSIKKQVSRNCILYLIKTDTYYNLIIKTDKLLDSLKLCEDDWEQTLLDN